MQSLARWLPFLNWPKPTFGLLRGEFWAGLTVGLMLLPQGVAYAALAGMPLITGIYASIIPAAVAILFSPSPRLGVGPTALSALLIGASLTGMAEPGSAQWVVLAAWMAILSGLVQWSLGVVRAGWLLNLVTSPVLAGFTQAAALLILASQLPTLLGMRADWSTVWHSPSIYLFSIQSIVYGLVSMALLMLAKKWRPAFPSAIFIIGLSGFISWITGFADAGGSVIGHLPAGLPSFQWPGMLDWEQFGALVMPVLVISLVSFLETASSAQVEHQQAGTRWNENQDLIAQGLSKISAGLFGSFATSASFSRSAVNLLAGARTGYANVFSILLVVVVVLWFIPWLYHVPQATLAAIVITAVLNLVKPSAILKLFKISKVEACISVATLVLTIVTAPRMYWGVFAGIMLSQAYYLYHHLHPRIIEVGEHPDGSLRSRQLWQLPPLAPEVVALRMDADLDFATATALERYAADALQQAPQARDLALLMQSINSIDITGVETFARLERLVALRGGLLHVVGLKLPAEQRLQRAGLLHKEGSPIRLYRTDADFLRTLGNFPTELTRINADEKPTSTKR
ncbi:sulfate transporter [Comamonas testosteroni]|uniref:Sulfate transporter n=1 Tax=Comamonas testosteroni TaxID=285 RepID=A0A0L7N2R4_COMTE|nr:SulP family inorganic anion transporter [Comamonas testosteroni]KOC28300.1 sulfate transporter [Comamonas testosteroni]KWT68630.1 Sulfate permease family protein [Comamonas testosteroni]